MENEPVDQLHDDQQLNTDDLSSSRQLGSEDDELGSSDDEPLAVKRERGLATSSPSPIPQAKTSADGQQHNQSKRSASQGDSSDTEHKKPRAKRSNQFKRIRSSERCGKCKTCLNPHLKKACETVRAQQSQHAGPEQKQAAKSTAMPANSGTYLRDTLARILSPSGRGGITDVKHMPVLQTLLENQAELGPRQVLLTVITISSDEVRTQVVKGQAIKTLESWVTDAADGKDTSNDPAVRATLICDVIKCLSSLPIDVDTLRRTGIGRTFGKLPKILRVDVTGDHTPKVAAACKSLVDQWKRLVEPSSNTSNGSAHTKTTSGQAVSDTSSSLKRKDSNNSAAEAPQSKKPKPSSQTSDMPTIATGYVQPKSQADVSSPSILQGVQTQPLTAVKDVATGASTEHVVKDDLASNHSIMPSIGEVSGDTHVSHAAAPAPGGTQQQQQQQHAPQETVSGISEDDRMQVDGESAAEQASETHQLGEQSSITQTPDITASDPVQQAHTSADEASHAHSQPPHPKLEQEESEHSNVTGAASETGSGIESKEISGAADHGEDQKQTKAEVETEDAAHQTIKADTDMADTKQDIKEEPSAQATLKTEQPNPQPTASGPVAPKPRPAGSRTGGLQLGLGRLSAGDSTRLGSLRGGANVTRLGSLRTHAIPNVGTGADAQMGAPLSTAAQIASSEHRAAVMFGGASAAALEAPVVALPSAPGGKDKLCAAERAVQAAQRAEAELANEPWYQPGALANKAKRKRVRWPEDDQQLQKIRWFRKDDPPSHASHDVQPTRLEAGGVHAPGFERAARREHAGERAALAAQHLHEEKERAAMLERLKAMRPNIQTWIMPRPIVLKPEWNVSAGEESIERHLLATKAHQRPPVSYPSMSHVPPTPAEPSNVAMDSVRDSSVLIIPLQAAGTTSTTTPAPQSVSQMPTPVQGTPLPQPQGLPIMVQHVQPVNQAPLGSILAGLLPAAVSKPAPTSLPGQTTATPSPTPSLHDTLAALLQQPSGLQGAAQPPQQHQTAAQPSQSTTPSALLPMLGLVPNQAMTAPVSTTQVSAPPAQQTVPTATQQQAGASATSALAAAISAMLGSNKGTSPDIGSFRALAPAGAQPQQQSTPANVTAAGPAQPVGSTQPAATNAGTTAGTSSNLTSSALSQLLASLAPKLTTGSTASTTQQPTTAAPATTAQAPVSNTTPPSFTLPIGTGPTVGHSAAPSAPPHAHQPPIQQQYGQPTGPQGPPAPPIQRPAPPPGPYPPPHGPPPAANPPPMHRQGPAYDHRPGQQHAGPGNYWQGGPAPQHYNQQHPHSNHPSDTRPMHDGGRHMNGGRGRGGGRGGQRVCAFYNTPNGCKKGDACQFLHVAGGDSAGKGPGS